MMKTISPILLCVMLCGCVEVEDFGSFWTASRPDEALIGRWQSADGYTCDFAASDQVLILRESLPTNTVAPAIAALVYPPDGSPSRTLTFRNRKFLLVKGRNSGVMRSYSVVSNQLTFFRFNDWMLEEGIHAGTVQGTVPDRIPYDPEKDSVPHPMTVFQNCKISVLTTNAMEFLVAKDNEKYWEKGGRVFTREETEWPTTASTPTNQPALRTD